ncbi:tRNA (adenosine(37)-N6)-threonylcarbamoyltransferase complex ATPase subunit type 1 TsaE [Lutispora thermophila]|uniref:tRNA threonylcarbamoyladenosine biosynthesis protein TsaE n=1 Tax=Lutispora thermophila DSM 19022 TaxID=1122184 RepID=A0A1M6AT68_9FIRM|nr:tRNA (adenosine(37)-N6)-threonylcarbamoyltransferase complex ATPase subunit type 1 TsaE [Lutispora thermophila]SHI39709.1 tRNA threonylcarbamoyladenosine biosynthesis protein TsaE [Lutispora thermophila DSM 19022]
MLKLFSKSVEDTYRIGERLGKLLFPGSIICLTGDLGAGKTAFTQGIGRGLGISEHVVSPTYTIINEYTSGRIPLYHFDVYRLGSSDEMYELGCDEYFYGDGATILEWADNVDDVIPGDRLWITIRKTENPEEREIIMEASGLEYERLLKEMKKDEDISN